MTSPFGVATPVRDDRYSIGPATGGLRFLSQVELAAVAQNSMCRRAAVEKGIQATHARRATKRVHYAWQALGRTRTGVDVSMRENLAAARVRGGRSESKSHTSMCGVISR
jgi:hypothetical protein